MLSARGASRVLRVARTIADLAGASDRVRREHVLKALALRATGGRAGGRRVTAARLRRLPAAHLAGRRSLADHSSAPTPAGPLAGLSLCPTTGPARALSARAATRAVGARASADARRGGGAPARGGGALEPICRHDAPLPARACATSPIRPPCCTSRARGAAARSVAGDAGGRDRRRPPRVVLTGSRRALARPRAGGGGGVTVVSGMALGIDSAAHAGALEGGGPTIAVLAGGADVAYPPSKRALRERIVRSGCAVSELPPGVRPRRWCFPARNRIIAGLAHLTIVVEAAERSGSLITAGARGGPRRGSGARPGDLARWPRAPTRCSSTARTGHRRRRTRLDVVFGAGAAGGAAPGPPRWSRGCGALLDAVGDGRDTLGRWRPAAGRWTRP